MAVAVKQVIAAVGAPSSTTLSATLPGAPTSGNLLVFTMSGDKNSGAMTLTGFTQQHALLGASVSDYVFYKISAGTETTINPSWATGQAGGTTGYYMELEDTAVSGSLWEVAGTGFTTYSDSTTNSRSSGTTGTLTRAALALAVFASDTGASVSGARSYTNSYAEQYDGRPSGSGHPGLFIATKTVASGTAESTFSYTGTADQTSGVIVAFAKVPPVVVTPDVLALVTATFAPTLTITHASAYQLEDASGVYRLEDGSGVLLLEGVADTTVTPGIATLTLATFAPTVLTPRVVTPGLASLSLSTFAPTVLTPRVVTPGIGTLSLATFAATVTATANRVVTPGLATLSLAAFAPTVTATANVTVTPGIAALSLATFAPTATATANVTVTPGMATLTLSAFAPTVTVGGNVAVTPGVATLALSAFAPTVTASDHKTVTPSTAALSLSAFAPTVLTPRLVTPGVIALSLATFAPTVTASNHKTVTPGTASLSLSTFAATVTATANVTLTPSVAALLLASFAPSVVASDHKLATPGTLALTLTGYLPTVTASDHKVVTPDTLALLLATFVPDILVSTAPAGIGPAIASANHSLPGVSGAPLAQGMALHSKPKGDAQPDAVPPDGHATHHSPEGH